MVDGSDGTKSNNGSKLTRRRLNEVWLHPPSDESEAFGSLDKEELEEGPIVSFSKLTRRCFLVLTPLFIIVSIFIVLIHSTLRENLVRKKESRFIMRSGLLI